jgi:polysaccharide export outer membrane protein
MLGLLTAAWSVLTIPPGPPPPPYIIEPPDVITVEVVRTDAGGQRFNLFPQPVAGAHLVRPNGTISLGAYGPIAVTGLTADQAARAVRAAVAAALHCDPDRLAVNVAVKAYNSKRYYVITDGVGLGEQVYSFPLTCTQTALDAIAGVKGLPDVAAKRNIWIARLTPNGQDQILPVDYVGITQHGITATNYQVLPGDRLYVAKPCLIHSSGSLRKIPSPDQPVLGWLAGAAQFIRDHNPFAGTTP